MKETKYNTKIHDKIWKSYNIKHSEIYNTFEQDRIVGIISKLTANKTKLNVLDFGAGTGNLSLKFLQKKCQVTATDVSYKSLKLLKKLSKSNPKLKIKKIKSKKIPAKNNSFDIVCTYSVLHHIPDYLYAVKEMIRVCKKGGIVYIDHEGNKNKYYPNKYLKKYNKLTKQTFLEHIKKLILTKELFTVEFFKSALIKTFINKRHIRDGDIHVWKDDFIDWNEIKKIVENKKCKIITECDYLMYKPKGGPDLYKKYKNKCNDMKYVIIQK